MNVKTIADQFCERPAVPASSHSADRLAERWRLSDFFELTKPRVMVLAVFTAVVGLISAPGQLDPLQALVAVLCIAAGAGAAGALNMWYDADIDAIMTRNSSRRCTIVTLEAKRVRKIASSIAESPPPTTTTSFSR